MDQLKSNSDPSPSRLQTCPFERFRGEQGAMLVETAFVMPVFCLLIFGTFILTMALISYCSATYAANVGVRYASVSSLSSLSPASTTQVANVVQQNLFMPGTPPNPVILVYYGNRSGAIPGNYIGDYVGIGVIVFYEKISIPFWGTKTFEMEVQAYRYISR